MFCKMFNEFDFGQVLEFGTPRWWFSSANTTLALVAVVYRVDRRDFGHTACGETRLLYRLGYSEADGTIQRLPAAFNVVFEQPDDGQGCAELART